MQKREIENEMKKYSPGINKSYFFYFFNDPTRYANLS